MEERTVKLSLEKAREFYNKGGEFKDLALSAFSKEELNALPNTWEEYKASVKNVEILNSTRFQLADSPFTNTELRAFLKLKFLRDCYRGKWEPDYKDNTTKPIIVLYGGNLEVKYTNCCGYFLAFQNESMANKFLKNFKNLIIEALSYLS